MDKHDFQRPEVPGNYASMFGNTVETDCPCNHQEEDGPKILPTSLQ